MSVSKSQLICHAITSRASDGAEEELERVLTLSNLVFGYNTDQLTKYSSASVWRSHLEHPRAAVFYATEPSQPETPLGFIFALPRLHTEIGAETLHIWLAGVHEGARGTHIFPFVLENTKAHARANGFSQLSVCTIPTKFEKMYSILQKGGWEIVARRHNGDFDNKKVLMSFAL